MIHKIVSHIKQGTLRITIRNAIKRKLGVRSINRYSVDTQKDAILLLIELTKKCLRKSKNGKAVLVTDQSSISTKIELSFSQQKIPFQKTTLDTLDKISSDEIAEVACVVAGFLDPKKLTDLGIKLVKHPALSDVPFEYSVIPKDSYATLLKHDCQKNTSFISPLLISEVDFFDIYESSLFQFEKKCQIRDYMDICQLIKLTIDRHVNGDVAEFGSYKGHSGYLISQILHSLNCNKKIFMFDMFEKFPDEIIGLDTFWSKTHGVDFEEVKKKFRHIKNTTLIKGDFTETFSKTDIKKLCFVYIDCDSYRGTKFLLNAIYDNFLSENGIIVLEDYGHGPLLGNRVAFHEFFDEKQDCFKFFSQYSGFQIVVKMAT